jgi:O-antigen/teichoic acid export membrane protein
MYAWPLVILAFWNWINNFSDRYIIEFFMDVKDVGIYNANYSLGSKFFILINPLFLSLLMPKIYANTTNEIKKIAINRAVKMYFLVGVPLLILIYYLREPLGLVLLSKEYSSGYYIIFWIAFAYFFLTLTYLYETIFYYNGNTKIILYSNITSAVINIIFNMVLIKLFGLPGAIISMMLSCIVRVLIIRSYFVRV